MAVGVEEEALGLTEALGILRTSSER